MGGLCVVFIRSSGANSESVHVSNEVDCLAYIHTDINNTYIHTDINNTYIHTDTINTHIHSGGGSS